MRLPSESFEEEEHDTFFTSNGNLEKVQAPDGIRTHDPLEFEPTNAIWVLEFFLVSIDVKNVSFSSSSKDSLGSWMVAWLTCLNVTA